MFCYDLNSMFCACNLFHEFECFLLTTYFFLISCLNYSEAIRLFTFSFYFYVTHCISRQQSCRHQAGCSRVGQSCSAKSPPKRWSSALREGAFGHMQQLTPVNCHRFVYFFMSSSLSSRIGLDSFKVAKFLHSSKRASLDQKQ